MKKLLLAAALSLLATASYAQSSVIGLPNQTGSSPVIWPTFSGSPVIGLSTKQYLMYTTFNEAASGTVLGTKPAIDVGGYTWFDEAGGSTGGTFVFNNPGATATNLVPVINTLMEDGVFTYSNVTVSGGNPEDFYIHANYPLTSAVAVEINPSAKTFDIKDYSSGGATTTLVSTTSLSTLTGNVILTVKGQTIQYNVFGVTGTCTVPSGSTTLHQLYFGVNASPPSRDGVFKLGGMSMSTN